MSTEPIGAALHGEDGAARSEAARMMGKAKTERKTATARENVIRATAARRGVPMSEEHKAKLRAAYAARRERENQERAALGHAPDVKEKKKPGRPAKVKPEPDSAETPRPRGRPKKQTGQNTIISAGTLETGAKNRLASQCALSDDDWAKSSIRD